MEDVTTQGASAQAATRETILKRATHSFATRGYTATTMRAIAEQAGIEVGSIYHHFPSKEALVACVMEQGADNIVRHVVARLDRLPSGANAEARLRAAIVGQMTGLIAFGDVALAHARLMTQLPESVRARLVERREQHQRLWHGLLDDLRAQGLLRADIDMSLCRVFLLACINSVQNWYDVSKGPLEEAANEICTMLLDGVNASCVPGGDLDA